MKREYQKPAFYMENFALSQSIAVICEGLDRNDPSTGHPTHLDNISCGWQTSVDTTWVSEPVCDDLYGAYDHVDIGCYNNTTGTNSVFAYS